MRWISVCAVAGAAGCATAVPAGPEPMDVEPAQIRAGTGTNLVVFGRGFVVDATVSFDGNSRVDSAFSVTVGGVALLEVVYVDAATLSATLPPDLALGTHDLVVTDPRGRTGTLASAVTVVECSTTADCASSDPCQIATCDQGSCTLGASNLDRDGDGHVDAACGGDDCDDDPTACGAACHPGAPEVCDGHDNDCAAATADGTDHAGPGDPCDGSDSDLCDEGQLECAGAAMVCTDASGDDIEGPAWSNPSCTDMLDNDCDGLTDGEETACHVYRRRITIRGNGGAVPLGYPVAVQLDHQSLVAAGKSAPSGRDIRIFDTSMVARPNWTLDDDSAWDRSDTTLWVGTPQAVPGDGQTHLWIYYGGPSGPGPHPSAPFAQRESCGGSTLDPTHWTVTTGMVVLTNGVCELQPGSRLWANTPFAHGVDTRWEARVRLGGDGTETFFNHHGATDRDGYIDNWITFWTTSSTHQVEHRAAGRMAVGQVVTVGAETTWRNYVFDRLGTTAVRYAVDGAEVASLSARVPSADLRAFIFNDSPFTMEIDWLRVRPYIEPEPSVSLGPEERAPSP